MITMNLNDNVWVKVTDAGYKVYQKHWTELGLDAPDLKVDFRGFTKMQLWEVMNIFGAAMYNGAQIPLETEICLAQGS